MKDVGEARRVGRASVVTERAKLCPPAFFDAPTMMQAAGGRAGILRAPWIAALAVGVVLVGHEPQRLAAPFGPSHDGFNAALYMSGGRAILEEGPLASRLGASVPTLAGDRIVYAHHPPLVYVANALALAAVPRAELAARLSAIVFSLLVLVLVVALLARSELSSGPAAVGLLAAFATPMFLMFGAVSEPHVLGLAPMTALVLLWRQVKNGSSVPSWGLASLAALATLTSWQAALFATIVAVVLFLVDRRRQAALAVLVGVVVPAVMIAGWIVWAYDGDLRAFLSRAIHRVGAGTGLVTFREMVRQQMAYFADLFPVGGWLVVPAAAFGLTDHRTRSIVAVSLGTVILYALLFSNGAYDHNYWLYSILLPLTLGAAAAADATARWLRSSRGLAGAPPAIAAALVAALVTTAWQPSNEQRQREAAAELGAQARALRWPDGQRYAYHAFGGFGPTDML
ncbi:MAG: hypothetical protein ACRD3C_07035, partial [Vicinamibacterales bacterium]